MIHHHIDIGSVLRGAVCALYSNLVTRPTGAAVRTEIERVIADTGTRTVTVIDFSQVTLLDYSCADEIVAKLMLRHVVSPVLAAQEAADRAARQAAEGGAADVPEGYFVFRGLGDHHIDAVEAVLERHRLAIVALFGEEPVLVGEVSADERGAWETLRTLGTADASALADAAGMDVERAAALLDALAGRRLVLRLGDRYAALGAAVRGNPGTPGAVA